MASVSSTSSSTSSTNSLYNTYGNPNAVTGLASGLDTESMIEQAVSGYQTKITSLEQKQTTVQWKQDAIREMITSLNGLSNNFASYKSKTNLNDASFFTSAITNSTTGTYAGRLSATGGSKSAISINSVSKLATAASYQVDAGKIFGGAGGTGAKVDWDALSSRFDDASYADRRISVTLDGVTKTVRFGDLKADDLEGFAKNLQSAVDDAFGADRVTVGLEDGALKFGAANAGSAVKAESDVLDVGLGSGVSNYINTTSRAYEAIGEEHFRVSTTQDGVTDNGDGTYTYNDTTYMAKDGYLVGTKTDEDGNVTATDDFLHEAKKLNINGKDINVSLTNTIGGLISDINLSGAGVTASYSQTTGTLTFTSTETGAGSAIKFGGDIGELFNNGSNAPADVKVGDVLSGIQWDDDGNAVLDLKSPGTAIGDGMFTINKNDSVETLMQKMNEAADGFFNGIFKYDAETGEYGAYNRLGNPMSGDNFTLTQWDSVYCNTQLSDSISLTSLTGNLNSAGVVGVHESGTDAELNVTVNGQTMNLVRSGNTFDIDGMSLTLRDTFNEGVEGKNADSVSFTSTVDTGKIIEGIQSFVESYNEIMKTVHDAYTTQPLEKNSSTHEKYKPLTDSDKDGMSESTIEKYEEKAKTGLLFGDSDLSGLYSKLRGALMSSKSALAEIGISIEYESESRVNFLKVDEDKLTSALEADVNKVAGVFAGGDDKKGLMETVASTVKTYASTSAAGYGILVKKAGANESATSQMSNTLQKEIDSLGDQVDNWKSKLSSKIDYYTRQFSLLEQLMNTYNSQSSMLASMMGQG